jgi:hypothetical protein
MVTTTSFCDQNGGGEKIKKEEEASLPPCQIAFNKI